MEMITLNVDGMSCSHCQNAVKSAIESQSGTSEVTVSLEKKSASFMFDAAIGTLESVKSAIREEGFDC